MMMKMVTKIAVLSLNYSSVGVMARCQCVYPEK
jgi:hypothetical protein